MKTKCPNYEKSRTFSKSCYSFLIYWSFEYIISETQALFLSIIYLECRESESSKLSLKMPHHFVLMKLTKTRLLKTVSKKIPKCNLCRMNSDNIFLMLFLRMLFRRLWGILFLLTLSHCQILRGVLEFRFDVTVNKIYGTSFQRFGGQTISVCNKKRGFECHLFSSPYICKVLFSPCTSASESKVVQWAQEWPLVSLPNTSGSLFFSAC